MRLTRGVQCLTTSGPKGRPKNLVRLNRLLTIERPFLKPGMNATVQISAVSKQNVLVLSKEAILSFRNRKMVRVIGEDGQPGRPQPVSTGVSSFDKTEIISGLEEGQVVSIGGMGGRGGSSNMERFRRMMSNPASTMRRMQGDLVVVAADVVVVVAAVKVDTYGWEHREWERGIFSITPVATFI